MRPQQSAALQSRVQAFLHARAICRIGVERAHESVARFASASSAIRWRTRFRRKCRTRRSSSAGWTCNTRASRSQADELEEALRLLPALDFIGVNLTIPHKVAAARMVDELDPFRAQVGAINTVRVEGDKLIGFNTDGPGFARAIRREFSVDLRDLRVLLFGAGGGAGRAIALAMRARKLRAPRAGQPNGRKGGATRGRAEAIVCRHARLRAGARDCKRSRGTNARCGRKSRTSTWW